jgi:flavin reductase (DIM6/NTAB) family NADH-FMN oxidoreductase RutF
MSIEPADFRRVLAHLAAGVTVVAASEPAGAMRGLTASAIASVSLEPPLVLACIDRTADTHDCIDRAGAFGISILPATARGMAERFAAGSPETKFVGVAVRREATGAPILAAAMAWLDCSVWARYDGGDHTIFVGEVLAAGADGGEPLVHFGGAFAGLCP